MPDVHVRQLIRTNLVTVLSAITLTLGNVFSGRASDLAEGQLPAIDVDTKEGGDIGRGSMFGPGRLLERYLQLTIGVTVKRTDGYLDLLDEIWLEIEKAIANNNSLVVNGVPACKWVQPESEPAIDEDDSADELIARAEMRFRVMYVTAFNAPQTLL